MWQCTSSASSTGPPPGLARVSSSTWPVAASITAISMTTPSRSVLSVFIRSTAAPGLKVAKIRERPGEPSPLRELARRPVDRAAAIRRWVAEYGDRHSIEVWAWFPPGSGDWELDFEGVDGGPSVKDVKAAIAAHRYLRDYPIAVATEAGAAIRWARAMREAGAAVILDTVIRADGCLSARAAA